MKKHDLYNHIDQPRSMIKETSCKAHKLLSNVKIPKHVRQELVENFKD